MDVNPNLSLNNINWKFNILKKCSMLFIENFLQLIDHTLTIILHRYITLIELKRSEEYAMHIDTIILILEP